MASLINRGKTFYLQDRLSGKLKRWGLRTDSFQLVKERLRQYESARLHGVDSPLPTRTPITDVLTGYVEHIRTVKTAKSAQMDIYYLREAFGPGSVRQVAHLRSGSLRRMEAGLARSEGERSEPERRGNPASRRYTATLNTSPSSCRACSRSSS